MSNKAITLCESETKIDVGLRKVANLYEIAAVSPDKKCLYLNRDKDIDIPMSPDDYIIIHGGEKIFSGDFDSKIGENPQVRHPITPIFNGKKLDQGLAQSKIQGSALKDLDTDLDASLLFADLSGKVDEFIDDNFTIIAQDADCYFTIPTTGDNAVDIEECSKHDRKPPKGYPPYKIKIDGEKYKVPTQTLTGEKILRLVEKSFDEWTLNRKFRGGRRKAIEKDEEVDFSEEGVERFETIRKQAQQG